MELQDIQTFESRTSLYHDNSETMDTPQPYIFIRKIKRGFRFITVEPVVMLYICATLIASEAISNLSYEMACRVNLQLNDTLCSNMDLGYSHVAQLLHDSYEQSTKLQTFSIFAINLSDLLKPGNNKSISSTTVIMIMLLYFATFSDQHKMRKTFIILSVLGEVFSCIGLILCAVFISIWPLERYFFMALILPAFFGGLQTLAMAVYSYVSDISTQEDRTFRMGIVQITSLLVILIAPLSTGLFRIIGYYGIFCISLVLFVVTLLYGHVFLKEKSRPKLNCNLLFDVFNPKTTIVDMCNVLLEKREGYRRCLLVMSYVCYTFIKGPMEAENIYFSIYMTELERNIHEIVYYPSIVSILGLVIGIILFTKKLKLNDYLIAIICCIIKIIVGLSIWIVSGTNLIFWFGIHLGISNGLFTVALRSVITKLVSPSEIAKSLALIAVCDVLHPLIFPPIYLQVYLATKDIFPEAVFLLTAFLIFIPIILLWGMHLLYKHYLKHPKTKEHSQPQVVQQSESESEREQFFVAQMVNVLRLTEVEFPVSKNK